MEYLREEEQGERDAENTGGNPQIVEGEENGSEGTNEPQDNTEPVQTDICQTLLTIGRLIRG